MFAWRRDEHARLHIVVSGAAAASAIFYPRLEGTCQTQLMPKANSILKQRQTILCLPQLSPSFFSSVLDSLLAG